MSLLSSLRFFRGEFELHLSTRITTPQAQQDFIQFCQTQGLKALVIELPPDSQGQMRPQQSMLSQRLSAKLSPEMAYQQIEATQKALQQAGFVVLRTKVEASIFNQQVPLTTQAWQQLQHQIQASLHEPYFEQHFKVLLPAGEWHVVLAKQGAHLSRNRLQNSPYRFVTRRFKNLGRQEAQQIFEQFQQDLQAQGFEVQSAFQEFVIYDSNLELDGNWGNVCTA